MKLRREIPERKRVAIINDYIDDNSSGETEAEESGSEEEEEEEAEKAHETAKLLAVSTVGSAKRNVGNNEHKNKKRNDDYANEEIHNDEMNENGSTGNSEANDSEDSYKGHEDDKAGLVETDNEEFIDTRSNVPRPNMAFYNGTNEFDENSKHHSSEDSLGLSDIEDIGEANVEGPSAYYTMEDQPQQPDDMVQSRSEIEDPDTPQVSDGSPTETKSLWHDAEVAEEKLANIPYPTGESGSRLKLFVNEEGLNKGESEDGVGSMHKKLISDLMQNVNGGKTIGQKFASKIANSGPNAETTIDGVPVIRSMTTRKFRTSQPMKTTTSKHIEDSKKDGGKVGMKLKENSKEKVDGENKSGYKFMNGKNEAQEKEERETYKKLKTSVNKQKNKSMKNKTWEAEVNTLFPGKASGSLIHTGLKEEENKNGETSKKHEVSDDTDDRTEARADESDISEESNEKRRPTAKETSTTDSLHVTRKRQCVGISVTDCIDPQSVTFNLPVSGQGEVGFQVNNVRAPGIVNPPGFGFNYQNGFQLQNQIPPDMRQFPAAFPSSATADVQQQYGSFQGLNGYDNKPHNFPGALPDHYPHNIPNMPESRPVLSKNRPTVPTMKPSENSIFKGGVRKKKKKKGKTTTPKPKKTTTKCPDCGKSKNSKASGGKKIPFTDKLWKLKTKKTTTTTAKPKTTPMKTERYVLNLHYVICIKNGIEILL